MYANYFGLKEPSFSITPDPQYLFLSEQHREALAHLVYGAGENGGFVLLTGEVGTGKTTICRAFLEQLPDHVDVALILNPAMTVTEMLRAVCDEFRISLGDDDRTVKRLVDRLNQYLLDAHARGRRPVLVIDESQNLQPKVLEQIRLLTNLETAKRKLLQIFLIGQPELRTLLQRQGLRQLNQRITARYHLRPFDARDNAEYVRHRLAVAGVDRALFTRSALRRVHRISGGVPRLINILCDRALLGAFVTRGSRVTRGIVDKAAREVKDGSEWRRPWGFGARAAVVALVALLALGVGWIALEQSGYAARMPLLAGLLAEDPAPVGSAPDVDTYTEETPAASPVPEPGLVAAARAERGSDPDIDPASLLLDETVAMGLLLRRWGVEFGDPRGQDVCTRVDRFGLRCETDQGGWSRLRDFDRPALLRLRDAQDREGFVPLVGLDAEAAVLDLPEGSVRISLARLDPLWLGEYLMVWQPPPVGGVVIGSGSTRASIRWLRKLLAQVPETGVEDTESGVFDAGMEDAVRRFQTREGLEVDGIAGPRTLIRLHNAVDMPGPPRLREGAGGGLLTTAGSAEG